MKRAPGDLPTWLAATLLALCFMTASYVEYSMPDSAQVVQP